MRQMEQAGLNAYTDPTGYTNQRRARGRRALRLLVAGRAGEGTVLVTVLNLSVTGMLVEADARLGEGEEFTCELPHAGQRRARVIWCSGKLAGCSFDVPISDAAVSAALLLGGRTEAAAGDQPAPFQASADFPARLRELRQARGLSLEDLATMLDISKQTVWYWEKGRNLPSPAHLLRLNQVMAGDYAAMARSDADRIGEPAAHDEDLPALLARMKAELARAVGRTAQDIEITIRF